METNKIDVVYVLGTGSKWNNNEIRFSLRSLKRNLKGFRNVIIVGEKPEFLKNVIHIKAADIFDPAVNADGNIITKVLAACNSKQVSDDFLFINDDHLVIKPINVEDVPPLHKGDMTSYPAKYWNLNFWRGRLKRTMEVLTSEHYQAMHYDCHTPILFNKHAFKEVVRRFDYASGIGYTMKSLYGNLVYKEKGVLLTSEKKTIFRNYTLDEIKARLETPVFMSFNDDGLNKSLKWWLIETFHEKSEYETNQPTDKVFDLFFWQKNGMDYNEGVQIFERYFKHKNLLHLLKAGETRTLRKKLEFKLTQSIIEL